MGKILFAILLFFLNWSLSAQDMLGVVNSNYSGVYGISLNPSGMVTSRLYMDFNLIGVQGFVDNNYMYIQRDEFVGVIRDRTVPVYYTEEDEIRHFDIYRNNENKFGYQNLKILGPSAMVVTGRHAFGITSSFRSVSSFHDLPPDIAVFLYEAIDYEFQHNIDYFHDSKIKASSMAWFELGLSYAYNFHRNRWNYWSGGITIKPLFGTAGLYTSVDNLDYIVHNDDSASINSASLEYGMALPVNYATNEYQPGLKIRGMGIGLDLGVTYQRTEKGHSSTVFSAICEPPYEEYNYRIGVSLIDFGFIKFNKNAIFNNFQNTSAEWYKPYDTIGYSSLNDVLFKIQDYFFNDAEVTETKDFFTLYLPPALSIQADVKLRTNLYLNFTGFYGLKVGKSFLYRPSVISFSPRYETPRWELSLPISFFEWNVAKPRVGFSFRFGNVFFGFDRINSIFNGSNFSGIDFYAGLRLNLSNAFRLNFIKGYCGKTKMKNIEIFDFRNF